jgi:hypothetical protein
MRISILLVATYDIAWISALRWRRCMSLKAELFGTVLVSFIDQSNRQYAPSLSICFAERRQSDSYRECKSSVFFLLSNLCICLGRKI